MDRSFVQVSLLVLLILGFPAIALAQPVYDDPVAFVALSSQYREDVNRLQDLNTVDQQTMALVKLLVLARFEVKLWVGHDGTPDSEPNLRTIKEAVEGINDLVSREAQRRYELNSSLPAESRLPDLHSLGRVSTFAKAEELEQPFAEWLSEHFGPDGSAPFGWVILSGHGEYRYRRGTSIDLEDHFLGPLDEQRVGGASLLKLSQMAFDWSAPLLVTTEMCRTQTSGEIGGDDPFALPDWLEVPADPPKSEHALSVAAAKLRSQRVRFPFDVEVGRREWTIVYNGKRDRPVGDDPRHSILRAIAEGLTASEQGELGLKKAEVSQIVARAEQPDEANFSEIFEYARLALAKTAIDEVQPEFERGPIERNMVVFSTKPNFQYGQPVSEIDLLAGAYPGFGRQSMTVEEKPNGVFVFGRSAGLGAGFAQLRLGLEGVHLSPDLFDDPKTTKWVRLEIEAVGPANETVQFLIQPGTSGGSFLSSRSGIPHTIATGETRRYSAPVDVRLLETPDPEGHVLLGGIAIATPVDANQFADPPEDVAAIEAAWDSRVRLRLKSATLVDWSENVDLGLQGEEIPYVEPTQQELSNRWWCNEALRANESLKVSRSVSRNEVSVAYEFEATSEETLPEGFAWGAEGAIDPPLAVAKERDSLRLTIVNLDEVGGKIGVEIAAGATPTLIGEIDLLPGKDAVTEATLPFAVSGDVDAMTLIVSGSRSIRLERAVVEHKAPQ